MTSPRAHLLVLVLVLVAPLLLGTAPDKTKNELTVELTFADHVSRERAAEPRTLVLALDAKNAEHPLHASGPTAGWKARTLAREVNVNGKAKGYWIELTLFAANGAEVGYLAATFPRDPAAAASAATKVRLGKDGDVTVILTRVP